MKYYLVIVQYDYEAHIPTALFTNRHKAAGYAQRWRNAFKRKNGYDSNQEGARVQELTLDEAPEVKL